MNMKEWAKREVEIACGLENPDRKEGELYYGFACYESALKAYNSLIEDGHSGTSWDLTKNTLMRLMEGKVLTPIIDTDDIWIDRPLLISKGSKIKHSYHCKRMTSLFKDVYEDGTVKYHDTNRVLCYDIGSSTYWHNGFTSNVINEKYPITMPYYPEKEPYIVYRRLILTDRNNGDYDTMAILYVKKPDGTIDNDIRSYYKESGDSFVEISESEYSDRLRMHLDRIEREEHDAKLRSHFYDVEGMKEERSWDFITDLP